MQMEVSQKKRAYVYAGLVQLGKFSAVVVDTGFSAKEGFNLPAGMNAAKPLGIVEEGIVPNLASDYNGRNPAGAYEDISQAAWPANLIPVTPQGIKRTVVYEGPIRARAAGAWSRGDRLITANNLGQLASVVTLGLPAGTQIFVVAIADEAAANPGDVAQVMVGIKTENV
jgi:hypothetical protein